MFEFIKPYCYNSGAINNQGDKCLKTSFHQYKHGYLQMDNV